MEFIITTHPANVLNINPPRERITFGEIVRAVAGHLQYAQNPHFVLSELAAGIIYLKIHSLLLYKGLVVQLILNVLLLG